ncbi:alanine--tRNA ligase-related protein, partial [Klebsiella pneumoniae]|uniref:alanine--tRNA ligase-related protein n=1 Tax=Klebsiella pneumoniae TaxID=573 RepID=UPI003B59701F
VDGQQVEQVAAGQDAVVILDQTPFYGESGGQVGDTGVLTGQNAEFSVQDTQKYGKAFGHIGKLRQGQLRVGDRLEAQVDEVRRSPIIRNH